MLARRNWLLWSNQRKRRQTMRALREAKAEETETRIKIEMLRGRLVSLLAEDQYIRENVWG